MELMFRSACKEAKHVLVTVSSTVPLSSAGLRHMDLQRRGCNATLSKKGEEQNRLRKNEKVKPLKKHSNCPFLGLILMRDGHHIHTHTHHLSHFFHEPAATLFFWQVKSQAVFMLTSFAGVISSHHLCRVLNKRGASLPSAVSFWQTSAPLTHESRTTGKCITL